MRVKCIKKNSWMWPNGWWVVRSVVGLPVKLGRGPRTKDVVTVESEFYDKGELFYVLVEWPGCGGYSAEDFEPIEEQKAEYKEVSFKKIKEAIPAGSEN